MTAKEYLRQLIDIDEQIRDYQDEILKVRTGMERMTPQMSGMPMGSPDPDKLAGHMDGLIAWQDRLNEAVDHVCRLKAEAMQIMERMPNEVTKRVLWKRYIGGKPFTLISVEMGYSYYRTCHLHGQGLREFEEAMKVSKH